MNTIPRKTYLERVKNWAENNKAISIIIIFFTITAAIISLLANITSITQFLTDKPIPHSIDTGTISKPSLPNNPVSDKAVIHHDTITVKDTLYIKDTLHIGKTEKEPKPPVKNTNHTIIPPIDRERKMSTVKFETIIADKIGLEDISKVVGYTDKPIYYKKAKSVNIDISKIKKGQLIIFVSSSNGKFKKNF